MTKERSKIIGKWVPNLLKIGAWRHPEPPGTVPGDSWGPAGPILAHQTPQEPENQVRGSFVGPEVGAQKLHFRNKNQ